MTEIKNRKSISNGKKYFDDLYQNGYTGALDYQQVLFKPGKVVQSRELNFLQSLLHEKIKSTNDLTYKNGSVIMGCDIALTPDELDPHVEMDVEVGDGVVYWDGTFFKFFSQTETFNYSDDAYIYLVVKYETVDYIQDNKLNDPAILYKIGKAINGADRLKITFEIKIKTSSDTSFDSENIQSFVIGSFKNGVISLSNRNPLVEEETNISESKVISGLKVRSNPMREAFTLSDDNEDFYHNDGGTVEKAFIEVEEGSAIVKGKEVVSSESKVFTFNKSLSSGSDNKQTENESKEVDFKNIDVAGVYGDISYGNTEIDQKTFLFDIIQPGKTAKVKIRIPLSKTVDGETTTEYKIFEVCEAEIADVYELWKESNYNTVEDGSPIIIDPKPITDDNSFNRLDLISSKIELPSGFNPDFGSGYSGAPESPEEQIYDTSSDWYAEVVTIWKINRINNTGSWNYSNWSNIEFKTVLNRIYDATGSIVDCTNGVSIGLVISNDYNIQSRTNTDVISSSDFIFNEKGFKLPNMPSEWINSESKSAQELRFTLSFSPSFMAKNKISVKEMKMIAKCSNPLVIPGNFFTDDNAIVESNVSLRATLVKNNNNTIKLQSIYASVSPLSGIEKITYSVDNKSNTTLNDSSNIIPLNKNLEEYEFTQSNIDEHITKSNNYDLNKFETNYDITDSMIIQGKFSVNVVEE